MVWYMESMFIAIGLLVIAALFKYSGFMEKLGGALGLIMAGVMFYVIDVAWTASGFAAKLDATMVVWLSFIWQLIAFILVLIGAIWGAIVVSKK